MGSLGFYVFGRFIAYYGLLIVLGLVCATILGYVQVRRFNLSWNDLVLTAAILGGCAVLGAKILYLVVSWKDIQIERLGDIYYWQNIMSGGFVFYGGLIGALVGMCVCRYALHIPLQKYVQYCTCCIPLGHAFGRVGCHMAGCCFGVPYNGWGSVVYTQSGYAPNFIHLFPVQGVEACGNLIITAILVATCKRLTGYKALSVYLCLYGGLRFVLEFFRYDEARGGIGGLSTSQLISLGMFVLAIALYLWERRRSYVVEA